MRVPTTTGIPATTLALLLVAVAVVMADSSVVILALPDILVRFDVEVADVAWVLTAYNLALGLAAVPAALWARGAPRSAFGVGAAVFSAASLACALAPGLATLVAARAVQAVGGALLLCAALSLLRDEGDPARAVRRWALAGVLGTAVGPAVGGALTQLVSWQAIFVIQVPIAALAVVRRHRTVTPPPHAPGRPDPLANLGLLLISAGLTAALFLVVLLMINGWGMRPLPAAVGVSVMPLAAIAAGRILGGWGSAWARGCAGALAIGGGLAALGLMPRAGVAWTIAPQLLVGLGLGLAVPALTVAAIGDRGDAGLHGGWTVASRHLGVVLGILLLTPLFVADFDRQQVRARDALTAVLLDSDVTPGTKIAVAKEGVRVLDAARGRVPDIGPALRAVSSEESERDAFDRLGAALRDRIARAATLSVSRSFLAAAGLTLLALLPIGFARLRGGAV